MQKWMRKLFGWSCVNDLGEVWKFKNDFVLLGEVSDFEPDELHDEGEAKQKDNALRLALTQLAGEFGRESMLSLQRFFSSRRASIISTGSLKLDLALGIGGLPKVIGLYIISMFVYHVCSILYSLDCHKGLCILFLCCVSCFWDLLVILWYMTLTSMWGPWWWIAKELNYGMLISAELLWLFGWKLQLWK